MRRRPRRPRPARGAFWDAVVFPASLLSIWYDWRDDGDDVKEAEDRFGIVRRKLNTETCEQRA